MDCLDLMLKGHYLDFNLQLHSHLLFLVEGQRPGETQPEYH